MKRLIASLAVALVITGCGSKQENVSVNSSSVNARTAPSPLVEATAPPSQTPTTTPTASPATTATERPVEFTYLGMAPDKEHVHYKVKVLTEKKISQVDLGVKYWDASGKVLDDTTFIWQNIVKSTRQPIEKGKTYDVLDDVPEGTVKADVVLKRVVFEDGTYWNAQ